MNRLKFIVRCLLSVGLLLFVARKVNWDGLLAVLNRLDPYTAVAASSLWGVLIAALAFRWSIFLRQQSISVPFREIFSITWGGQFFNSLLPGSTGGDVFKIYQLCRLEPTRKAAAAATVLVDRFSALFALLVFAAVAFAIEPGPVRGLLGGRFSASTAAQVMALGLIGAVIGWLVIRRFAPAAVPERILRLLGAFRQGLAPSMPVAFAFALAFAIHLLNFLSVYLFARALGIDVTLSQVLLMMPVLLLLVMLPVTINGHGLRELLLIGYFSYMGVRVQQRADIGVEEVAVALSLLLVANDLLWSFPGGIRYLMRGKGRAATAAAVAAALPTDSARTDRLAQRS